MMGYYEGRWIELEAIRFLCENMFENGEYRLSWCLISVVVMAARVAVFLQSIYIFFSVRVLKGKAN